MGGTSGTPKTRCREEADSGSMDSREPSEQLTVEEKEYSKDAMDADFEAFQQMLPDLLKQHRGEFALIIKGKLIRIERDEFDLLKYAYSHYPDDEGIIQPILQEPPLIEVGGSKYLVE